MLEEKPQERKKNYKVVSLLKESLGATEITKRILDLKINLTIGELLASAPSVEKQLTKALWEDEVVQFRLNTVKLGNPISLARRRSEYAMGYPRTKALLEIGNLASVSDSYRS